MKIPILGSFFNKGVDTATLLKGNSNTGVFL